MTTWSCTRCGACCQTLPAVVVTQAERALLEARGPAAFDPHDELGFWSMRAGPCPYYANGCTVYDVRPYNCRRYASLNGYQGSDRDAHRVQVLIQRRAQLWANRHGWSPSA